jgi:hypothetical protein
MFVTGVLAVGLFTFIISIPIMIIEIINIKLSSNLRKVFWLIKSPAILLLNATTIYIFTINLSYNPIKQGVIYSLLICIIIIIVEVTLLILKRTTDRIKYLLFDLLLVVNPVAMFIIFYFMMEIFDR